MYPLLFLASFIAFVIVFARSRRKILYVDDGNIVVRGIFKKVCLDPYELKSISRTRHSVSGLPLGSLVVVETSGSSFSVYTRKITDEKWTAFVEDLK